MRDKPKTLTTALTGLGVVAALLAHPGTASAEPVQHGAATQTFSYGDDVVTDVAEPRNWDPLTPAKWSFENDEIIQHERGTAPPGPRRPFEYTILRNGPEFTSVSYEAQVRIDEPVTRNDRDVILVSNYRSPTRFYYAHLSQDNTVYPHNGIFVVNDADRLRIDDQWNGRVGAAPAIDDVDWHDVRLDYCGETGRIEVYVDGADTPLMTATDTTFSGGRIGFGSFDNYGRARGITVTGTGVPGTAPSTDSSLASLSIDGHAISGFDPAAPNHSVVLPKNASVPEVAATPNHAGATVEVSQAEAVPGAATVLVTAEDRSVRRYTVSFRTDQRARPTVTRKLLVRCVEGRAHLSIAATNRTRTPLDIRVASDYGDRSFPAVGAGASVEALFDSSQPSIPSGAVSIGAYRDDSGETAYTKHVASYPGRTCS